MFNFEKLQPRDSQRKFSTGMLPAGMLPADMNLLLKSFWYLIMGLSDWETDLAFCFLPSNTAPSSFQFNTRVARWAARTFYMCTLYIYFIRQKMYIDFKHIAFFPLIKIPNIFKVLNWRRHSM